MNTKDKIKVSWIINFILYAIRLPFAFIVWMIIEIWEDSKVIKYKFEEIDRDIVNNANYDKR